MKKITVEIEESSYQKLLEVQLMLKKSGAEKDTLAASVDWAMKQVQIPHTKSKYSDVPNTLGGFNIRQIATPSGTPATRKKTT